MNGLRKLFFTRGKCYRKTLQPSMKLDVTFSSFEACLLPLRRALRYCVLRCDEARTTLLIGVPNGLRKPFRRSSPA
jgi:hypothetical protein